MSLFGVYDGHGGAEVAEWVSKKFPDILKKEFEEEKIDLNEAFGKRIQEIFVKTGTHSNSLKKGRQNIQNLSILSLVGLKLSEKQASKLLYQG